MRAKVWIIDTTGKIADLVKQNKLVIEEGGDGGGGGPGPRGLHKPGMGLN